ncbi:MAG: tetratricopeptide repeat protein [Acidobacteria bacterium]|nr:MAG: tetratricopeptide repeat protein [Acidobacteriota bacterium]
MKAFERAVNLFHRHKFESAQRAFTQFIERYPQEAEMVVRARSYLAICQRQLSRPPATPRDAEALYDRGIVELNYGRIREAISYFQKALKRDPEAPHILYSLAAAHARLGQLEQALEELKEAVKRREVLRIHARRDADFVNLYAHPEFQQLVGWEVVEESPPLSPSTES